MKTPYWLFIFLVWASFGSFESMANGSVSNQLSLTTAFTIPANEAILLDNHVDVLQGFVEGESYTSSVSGSPTMPLQGALFMYIDNLSHRFAYVASGDVLSFTPGGGSYKIAPFLVDWSLGDNSGSIEVDLSDGRGVNLAGNGAILLDDYPQFPILGGFESGKTYLARIGGSTNMPMQGVFVMYIDDDVHKFAYVPIGGCLAFTPGAGSYKFCAFQVDWSTTGDNVGETTVDIYELPTSPNQTVTIPANEVILLDNHVSVLQGFVEGETYTASVTGTPTMPMQGSMFMYIDNLIHKFAVVPSGDALSFTPGSGAYKIAPFLVDWSFLGDNTGSIGVALSDGRNVSLQANQAILLDGYSQFPILDNFEDGKTYVARIGGNPTMPMQGVFIMYIDNGIHKFEYVPIGGCLSFTPGAGSYKFCAFQVDWSDIGDNSGETTVDIYDLDTGIPCDAISFFKARCNGNGTAQAMIRLLNSTGYAGETVEIQFDNTVYPVELITNGTHTIGRLAVQGAGVGQHTITLLNPAGCYDPINFTCQVADAPSDPEFDALWDEYDNFSEEPLTSEASPRETKLHGNYPNPFNPSTTLSYTMSQTGNVSLKIYNMLGELVRTMVDEHQSEGHHEVVWDGRNEIGLPVASGLYMYRMVAGKQVETRKMMLTK